MQCLFCDIINGRTQGFKVWENNELLLLLDIHPINPGHLLLITKKHHDDIFSIPEPLYGSIFASAKEIAVILQKMTGAKRIGLAIEGFGVPHVHIHLVPVNQGNELNPLRAKSASEEELQRTQEAFSKQFNSLN